MDVDLAAASAWVESSLWAPRYAGDPKQRPEYHRQPTRCLATYKWTGQLCTLSLEGRSCWPATERFLRYAHRHTDIRLCSPEAAKVVRCGGCSSGLGKLPRCVGLVSTKPLSPVRCRRCSGRVSDCHRVHECSGDFEHACQWRLRHSPQRCVQQSVSVWSGPLVAPSSLVCLWSKSVGKPCRENRLSDRSNLVVVYAISVVRSAPFPIAAAVRPWA
jgi:hypothetical protein